MLHGLRAEDTRPRPGPASRPESPRSRLRPMKKSMIAELALFVLAFGLTSSIWTVRSDSNAVLPVRCDPGFPCSIRPGEDISGLVPTTSPP